MTDDLVNRVRLAALLVLAGLAVEVASLGWRHPIAFLLFAITGGALLASGVSLILRSLTAKATAKAKGG
jgi:hypothetical protein